MYRLLSILFAAAIVLAQSSFARAEDTQSAQTVLANLAKSQRAPNTFQATTSVQLKKRGFPWTTVALNGTSYYEAPNHLAVRFTNLPGYMSGLPGAYAKVLNVGAWPGQYTATLGQSRSVNGHTDLVLQLAPKDSASSDRGVVAVNPADWTVEQVSWNLSGGVQLNMSEGYARVGTYRVPATQLVSIRTPYATADGSARLQNYAVNIPINRRIFAQE